MPNGIKRALIWGFFLFFIYMILVSPERAADIIGSSWETVSDGFRNIVRFFELLVG